jgi:hypothetical protein
MGDEKNLVFEMRRYFYFDGLGEFGDRGGQRGGRAGELGRSRAVAQSSEKDIN